MTSVAGYVSLLLSLLTLSACLTAAADVEPPNAEGSCDANAGGTDDAAAAAAADTARRAAAAAAAAHQARGDDACRLYLAESTVPNSGLGMFTAVPMPRGRPIGPPDIVIQISDLAPTADGAAALLLSDYLWDGQETGGQYEGARVYSAVPGVGMLANGHLRIYNALPFRPDVDEADVPRTTSAGAGAFSHYHNYSYYTQRPVEAGGEIFVNYGLPWFREREGRKGIPPPSDDAADTADLHVRSRSWLRSNGLCLDNIKAGRSTVPDAGRGAFATRPLPAGSVIAPAPVVPITERDALRTVRVRAAPSGGEPDVVEEGWQLLRNYCYGHVNSSVLLFPYSPVVNFINHADDTSGTNAILRWSNSTQHRGRTWPGSMSLEELRGLEYSGLMLEFVATRDIQPGEEIFIDYGTEWTKAWKEHVDRWKPVPGATSYTPSYVMDDVASVIRTEEEQRDFPYGDNLITSCFYRYSDNAAKASSSSSTTTNDGGKSSSVETTAVKWEMKRGIFDYNNLRPCSILRRDKAGPDGRGNWYTVLIRNRYGLAKEERIPKGTVHVVNFVPRHAIRFSDKLYTTDQHLPNAFRHEIGLPDGVFPEAWMDLA